MTFQEQLDLMRAGGVPLPLMPGQADAQALRLRSDGHSYSAIALIMRRYHGTAVTSTSWRRRLRSMGVEGKHHAGRLLPHMRQES